MSDFSNSVTQVQIMELPNQLYHGYHVSIAQGYKTGLKEAYSLGCHGCQVFLRPPQSVNQLCSKMDDNDAKNARKFAEKNDIKVVVHSPYTVNFAHYPDSDTVKKMMIVMLDEFRCAEKLGAIGCVIHMGKRNTKAEKIEYDQALKNKIKNIQTLLKNVKAKNINGVKLILETSCGAGSEMCSKTKDLAILFNSIKKKYHSMIGFCIDTCHIFTAGYNISTSKGALKYLKKFDRYIGLGKVDVIHFNDSRVECGCKKDRHQFIGAGYIASQEYGGTPYGLAEIARFAYLRKLPIILETGGPIQPQLQMIELFSGFSQTPKL